MNKLILKSAMITVISCATAFSVFAIDNKDEISTVSAKAKVVKGTYKINKEKTQKLKPNTTYTYNFKLNKTGKYNYFVQGFQDEKTMMKIVESSKSLEKAEKKFKKMGNQFYDGTVGTFKVKSSDGKKTYLTKKLTTFDYSYMNLNKDKPLKKGNYIIEIKTNNNLNKTKLKTYDLTYSIIK